MTCVRKENEKERRALGGERERKECQSARSCLNDG